MFYNLKLPLIILSGLLFFNSSFIFTSETKQFSIKRLDEKKIDNHKQYFNYMMRVHRIGQFTILVGIPFYQLYSLCAEIAESKHGIGNGHNPAQHDQVAKPPLSDRFISWCKSIGESCVDIESWITGAKFVGHIGIIVGTNIVLSKFAKIFDHDHTIHWCVRKHGQYSITFKQLKKDIAEQLQDGQTDIQFFELSFSSACNTLIDQLEHIIGFMLYKAAKLPTNKIEEGRGIAQYLIKETNEFCINVTTCNDKHADLDAYINLFEQFERKLSNEIEHFALIDPEKDERDAQMKLLQHHVHELAEDNMKLRATLLAAIQSADVPVVDMTSTTA